MSYLESILLALIEGITEYLPISSTGHLIIASFFMDIEKDPFVKTYNIAIQFGAILSIVVLYFKRFLQSVGFYYKLFVAFLPAAIVGLLIGDYIDALLENVYVVAFMLIIGGIFLIYIDKLFPAKRPNPEEKTTLSLKQAFHIGLFQLFALIPGTSRSAATIIGGMFQKLSKKEAAEFSFFLAVPTLFGATCYKLYTFYNEQGTINSEEINLLIVGNIIAFVSAALAVKGFINLISKIGFKVFGYYRILLGIVVIILAL